MRLTIGVMGSSGGDLSAANLAKAHRLGEAIAARDAVLITGGCPGLPYEAVRGAKAQSGLVIGISPGLSLDEHRGKYRSPVDGFDVLELRVLQEDALRERPHHGDEHVLVDRRSDQKSAVLAVVRREIGAAAAEGDAQWTTGDDHEAGPKSYPERR